MANREAPSPAPPPASGSERVPVGFALAALRRDSEVAQEQLARRLGISRVAISHYESAQIAPSYSRARWMLSYMGRDLRDLQDMLDKIEQRPPRPRRHESSSTLLEETLLADAETLFRRWEGRLPLSQKPLLEQAESEVMDALRRFLRSLDTGAEAS